MPNSNIRSGNAPRLLDQDYIAWTRHQYDILMAEYDRINYKKLSQNDIIRYENTCVTRFTEIGRRRIAVIPKMDFSCWKTDDMTLPPGIFTQACEATDIALEKVRREMEHHFDPDTGKYKESKITSYVNDEWKGKETVKLTYVEDITDTEFLAMLKSS